MRRVRTKHPKPIASRDGVIVQETSLPLPVVHYPGFYGAFFGFGDSADGDVFFCSCAKTAIEHYILLRLRGADTQNAISDKQFLISSNKFPDGVVHTLMNSGVPEDKSIIGALKFGNSICHECNRITPSYAYCVPMYGSVFEQHYGWYINQQSLDYGVMPTTFSILPEVCPDEVFTDSYLGKGEFIATYGKMSDRELLYAAADGGAFRKQTRRMRNIIENEVRVRFGFKKVGDAWASETLLYQLVSELFVGVKILRHYRALWLENLELDIFVPSLNLAVEYQGIQHFEGMEHWGGALALERTQERDKRKKQLCAKQGVSLIYFYHSDTLSHEVVKSRLVGFR
jgi:hypothetical protein